VTDLKRGQQRKENISQKLTRVGRALRQSNQSRKKGESQEGSIQQKKSTAEGKKHFSAKFLFPRHRPQHRGGGQRPHQEKEKVGGGNSH